MPGANNPLNIRYNPSEEWEGQIGQTGGFADFETLRHGIRAGDINLQNYGKLHGINTLEGVINRWAPPSDNNPTQNYVDFVSSRTGIIPTQRLDLNDPRLRADILSAMADFENEGNNNVAADAIRQSRISVPIAVAGLDRPSGASEAARRIERGEQERYGAEAEQRGRNVAQFIRAEAEQRGREVAQFIREDEQLEILGGVVRGAGNVVGDAWTTYMSEPAGEIGGAVQARWRDTMDNLRSRDRERLFEPNPERDRLMVAGMFPELEGLEEGSIPEELLRADAGNIAASAAEEDGPQSVDRSETFEEFLDDVNYLRSIGNLFIGDEEGAIAAAERAQMNKEQAGEITAGSETFEEFLDEPTFGGFMHQVFQTVGMVTPFAAETIATALTGGVAGFGLKLGLNASGRATAKKVVKDLVTKKSKDKVERELLEDLYTVARRNYFEGVGKYAKRGGVAGAFAGEYPIMTGEHFGEFDEAGVDLNISRALQAMGMAFPSAAVGVAGESMLLSRIGRNFSKVAAQKAAGDTSGLLATLGKSGVAAESLELLGSPS